MNLDTSNSKENSAKLLIDSDNSYASDSDSNSKTSNTNNPKVSDPVPIISVCQENNAENPDDFDKLCIPCVGNTTTQVVR